MSMRLIFLGTGPASPIPRIYCFCPVCRHARKPKNKSCRTRSSALISLRGKHILIDAGPDILAQLGRARTFHVDAVILTHAHNDAAGGLFDLDDILRKQRHPATLYVERGTWQRIKHDLGETAPWFRIKTITAGRKFEIFGAPLMPFRVLHSATKGFPTLGYRIGNNLVYASDIKRVPKSSEHFIREAAHAVLDGCMWFGQKIPTHFTVDDSVELAARLKIKNLYLTQISHNYPPYPEAARAIRAYCRKQKITTKVTLAYDGLVIPLD